MSRRKPGRGGGSSLLARVNRISRIALVTNIGLVIVLSAIIERVAISAFGVRGSITEVPDPSNAQPSDAVRPSQATQTARPPIRLAALTTTVQQAALAQRGALARRTYGTKTTGRPIVQETRSTRTWTFGTTALPPPKGSQAMPEVSLFLARVVGRQWRVAFSGTKAFTTFLEAAPASLIPNSERQLLARYSSGASGSRTDTNDLMLPWLQGQTWSLVADRYGVGFTGGDGKVLAAADGRVYRFCTTSSGGGLIMLIHSNGLATEYYQLTNQPKLTPGDIVKRGTYLGKVGTDHPCGGGSDEPQVRFALRQADRVVSIAGHTVGGWTFHEGTDLDRYVAVRDDRQVLPGEDVVNLGVPKGPGLPGLPGLTGSPNESDTPGNPAEPSTRPSPLLPTPKEPRSVKKT
ncbi:MAG TPA: M23 family metallopeptidase [Streptosporangiaceae bacterium]|nr:M23 family metallopeptidase [Streptosporangiaceae bacterium]